MKNNLSVLFISLILFGLSFGASYGILSLTAKQPKEVASPQTQDEKPLSRKSKLDPNLPKTEICPLNGAMFTVAEKKVWETRRPLAVMIENSVDSRPQSGLSSADIVYEAIAEGGITRFMGMYYCDAALTDNLRVAPVRSARIYYVNLLSEYDPLYNHVGGAGNCDDINVDDRAKALCLIDRAKIKNMDQMGYAGDFKVCHREANRLENEVAYEHTMSCFVDEIYNKAAKLKWANVDEKNIPWNKNFVSWKFQNASDQTIGSPASAISYMFWTSNRDFNGNYDAKWTYQTGSGSYERSTAGKPHLDLDTGKQLTANTVIVQFTKETLLNDKEKHLLYDVIGKGKALVFMDGMATEATWTKTSRTARTIYYDLNGKELKLNPGPIWISILPSTNTVEYN